MFCVNHPIPHEDCPNCLPTVAAMRRTVFAELAAAELCSGTECCPDCDYVYYEAVAKCPQCGEPHPFHPQRWRHARRQHPIDPTTPRLASTGASENAARGR